jgi:hypothetical protein
MYCLFGGVVAFVDRNHFDDKAIGSKASFFWDLETFWEADMNSETIRLKSGPAANPNPDFSPISMGMFATTKRWWQEIDGMDRGLLIWGGENIDISLRTWLCGGEIVVARGSFIDHAFRTATDTAPWGSLPAAIHRRNLVRVVEAWFDAPSKVLAH